MSEWVSECVSEWVSEKPILHFVQLYHGENFQWDDDDDEVRFVLDQHAELDFYGAISLKQQSADRYVASLGHIILLQSQPVFALSPYWCACFAEEQQILIL